MVKALIRVSKTLAAVSAILVILAALLACGETTPIPGGAVATVPAATEAAAPSSSPPTQGAEPTETPRAVPTATPRPGAATTPLPANFSTPEETTIPSSPETLETPTPGPIPVSIQRLIRFGGGNRADGVPSHQQVSRPGGSWCISTPAPQKSEPPRCR